MQKIALFFRENLHSWHKFYTTDGRDGRDKFQVWFHDYDVDQGFAPLQ